VAANILTKVKNDGKFLMAYYALVEVGFNINFVNEDDTSFLEALCLTGVISVPKIRGIIQTNPDIDHASFRKLEAKLMLNIKRYNNPTVRRVLDIIRLYML
jgi:hypothetical protein